MHTAKPGDSDARSSTRFLSPRELADLLGVSLPTIYRMVERRAIAFVRVGGRLRFIPEDVERYVTFQRVHAVRDTL